MSELSDWLRRELEARSWSQLQASVQTGIAAGTISGMLSKDHVPRVEILFRLADFFNLSREQVLRLAGHLPPRAAEAGEPVDPRSERYVQALLTEFRHVPDEWKPYVVQQVAQYRQLAAVRPQIIGDDAEPEPQEQEEQPDAQAPAPHAHAA